MTWTWDQFNVSLPTDVWKSFLDWYVPGAMMVGTLLIVFLYPLQHLVMNHFCAPYRSFEAEQDKQLVILQHSVEATVLGVSFIPLTYLILSINFQEQDLDRLHYVVGITGTFMFCITVMFLVELAMRFRYARPLVIAHHLCAYANSVFPAFCLTTANMKAASLLVYFTTYEALTFVGLVLYRLYPTHKHTPRVILAGMIVFGATRPVQLVWIIGSLAATWADLVVWQAVIQVILSLVFTILQCFSLKIHYGIYRKVTLRIHRRAGCDGNVEKNLRSAICTSNDDDDGESIHDCDSSPENESIMDEECGEAATDAEKGTTTSEEGTEETQQGEQELVGEYSEFD